MKKDTTAPVFLYVVLVFVAGLLVGGFGSGLFYHEHPPKAPKTISESPNSLRRLWEQELESRLKLTPEQTQKLDGILDECHVRYHALRAKYWPEVKTIQDWQADEIRGILNPTQLQEYEKMRAERDAAIEKRQRE